MTIYVLKIPVQPGRPLCDCYRLIVWAYGGIWPWLLTTTCSESLLFKSSSNGFETLGLRTTSLKQYTSYAAVVCIGKQGVCIYICRGCFWNSSWDLAVLPVSGEKTERPKPEGQLGIVPHDCVFISGFDALKTYCLSHASVHGYVKQWLPYSIIVPGITKQHLPVTLGMGKICTTRASMHVSSHMYTHWRTELHIGGFKNTEWRSWKYTLPSLCASVCACIVYACVCYVCVGMLACLWSPENNDNGCLLSFSTLNFATWSH